MQGYGQFCPIAKAAEILAERWTLLLIRELVYGSRRYNDLRRGVPKMSPSLLSARLKKLERVGILERQGSEYRLTQAGLELRPLIYVLGSWGKRWVNSNLAPEDLDPGFLMWAIRRNLKVEHLPSQPAVAYVEFHDQPKRTRQWWLLADRGDVDLCLSDPGHEVSVYIYTDVATLTRVFECQLSIREARTSGALKLHGMTRFIQTMDAWFGRPVGRTRALLVADARKRAAAASGTQRPDHQRSAAQ